MLKLSDQYLIECIKSGDEKPLEYLYKQNFRVILNYIKKNNGQEDDAKDIFQEALVTFWEKVLSGHFELSASISTVLFAISKNKWLNVLRKRTKETSISNMKDEGFQIWYDIEISESSKIQIDAAIKCLNESTEHCKKMLEFYYWYKYSTKEICKQMELKNEDTVKSTKYKCLKKLEICTKNRLGLN